MVLAAFSVRIGLERVQCERITIAHVCFIALTLAVPSDDFEYSAYRPRVQTASSGPDKC